MKLLLCKLSQINTTKYSKNKLVNDHIGTTSSDKNILNKTAVKKSKLCARFCQNVNKRRKKVL